VVPHRNRSLRLGMAGRGSGDTIIRFGWHVQRLRQRESSSHGQVPGLCITVMMQLHEFRRGLAPGALRRDHCQHGVVRKAADPASASEVDLDARPSADRRQSCNENRQLIGLHHSAVQDCPRTLAGPERVARGIKVRALYCSLLNFACLGRNRTQSRLTLSHPFRQIHAAGQ